MQTAQEGLSEDLQIQGTSEWRNIPSVIKQAFVRLFNQVKEQSIKLDELQNKQGQLVQQQDFVSALAGKVSLKEHRLKSAQLEEQIASCADANALQQAAALQRSLQDRVHTLMTTSRDSHADLQQYKQFQQKQAKIVDKKLHTQVAALSAASAALVRDVSAVQQRQDAAEKSAFVALSDVHKAIEVVRHEAAASADRLSSSFHASTSDTRQSQAMQHSAVQQSIDSVLRELAQLASGNRVLKSHLDSKADKSYLLQVMEHLRSTKASVADLQDVQDVLYTKAAIKDVNATLTQVSEDLNHKASATELAELQLFRTGGIIGPSGRWHWSNGRLTRNGAVFWDKHCTVSDPEYFHHKQGHITVVKAGLYHLTAAFFSHCKASFQVLVNDHVVVRAGSHAACSGQHSAAHACLSDGLMQKTSRGSSVAEYLAMPAEACLSVKAQSQHEGWHGFLALQQIC